MIRWRRPYFYWVPFMVYPVLLAGAGLFAYDAFNSGRTYWQADAGAACALLFLWRLALIGVLLKGDRIKVRGWFRTRLLRWEEVAAVQDGRDLVPASLGLAFVLKSGERVRTLVQGPSASVQVNLSFRQFGQMMARLQERHTASV